MGARLRETAAKIRAWLAEGVETTRGGVVLVVIGWVIVASASLVGVIQVERLSNRQLDDLGHTLDAVEHEALVREYEACRDAVEGRMALRETMNDLYDGIESLGDATATAFATAQRILLDQRRPPLSVSEDCPAEPGPVPRIEDGDD